MSYRPDPWTDQSFSTKTKIIYGTRERLGEGYVFSRVCLLFTHRGKESHVTNVTITHDALDFIVQPPPSWPHPRHENSVTHFPPASDIWWPQLEICSDLFTSGSPCADIWWMLEQTRSV